MVAAALPIYYEFDVYHMYIICVYIYMLCKHLYKVFTFNNEKMPGLAVLNIMSGDFPIHVLHM